MGSTELMIRKTSKLMSVRVREFNQDIDTEHVQALEGRCDDQAAAAVPAEPGKTSILFTNLERADPLCRVRSYPIYCMLVAETQLTPNIDDYSIVGIVRAGIKQVIRPVLHTSTHKYNTTGTTTDCPQGSTYITAMYISGLRVCCLYRRLGVAQQLVTALEAWGTKYGAEYAYMATETDNQASINLFVHKLGYIKFRSPSLLVQPVYGKPMPVHNVGFGASRTGNKSIQIIKVSPVEAARLYRKALGGSEFFPKDIDSVLGNPLNAGTWLACYKNDVKLNEEEEELKLQNRHRTTAVLEGRSGGMLGTILKRVEEGSIAWAILSLWRYDKLIKFKVRGESKRMRRWAALTRLGSRLVPWVVLPCLPNVFDKAFGVQLMYGMHAYDGHSQLCTPVPINGPRTSSLEHHYYHDKCSKVQEVLMEKLCWHAHNLALQAGCKAVVAEMSSYDPLKAGIPHWPCLSDQDLWCLKRMSSGPLASSELDPQAGELQNWCKWPPFASLFLDPRDF